MEEGELAVGFHNGISTTICAAAGRVVVGVRVSSTGPVSPTLEGEAVASMLDAANTFGLLTVRVKN